MVHTLLPSPKGSDPAAVWRHLLFFLTVNFLLEPSPSPSCISAHKSFGQFTCCKHCFLECLCSSSALSTFLNLSVSHFLPCKKGMPSQYDPADSLTLGKCSEQRLAQSMCSVKLAMIIPLCWETSARRWAVSSSANCLIFLSLSLVQGFFLCQMTHFWKEIGLGSRACVLEDGEA